MNFSKRTFDILLAIMMILVFSPVFVFVMVLVKFSSKGPIFYWSDRVGLEKRIFRMPKFRTLCVDAPQVASHLLPNPDGYRVPLGSFLRRSSLDELPQLWSILRGDLSFVGPRPALFNQYDLIALRELYDIHTLVPGLTGWAQINGRDALDIPSKVRYDYEYFSRRGLLFDLRILFETVGKIFRSEGVSH